MRSSADENPYRSPEPVSAPFDAHRKTALLMLAAATLSSLLLYLDRVCIAEFLKHEEVVTDLKIDTKQIAWTFSAFFWSYALFQVPSGWLTNRFGARGMMVVYILAWSACTALGGLATGFVSIFAVRLGLGFAQAGAYPTCGSLVRQWVPLSWRARASSLVAFGGRLGGAMAPPLTTFLVVEANLHWRATMLLYGALGIFVAILFWRVVRERPSSPDLPPRGADSTTPSAPRNAPKDSADFSTLSRFFVRDASMWLMCFMQFATNVGWAFLVSWMPTYFKNEKHVDAATGARMVGIPLFAGMFGLLLGGYLTDACTRAWGMKWGRNLPLAFSRFLAAGAFVVCLHLQDPWSLVVAFSIVAVGVDLGVGATWAYVQDVGGRNVAEVLGWGNMWGNLGAAASPVLIEWFNDHYDSNKDWHESFLLMAASFTLAGIAALGLNATRTVERYRTIDPD